MPPLTLEEFEAATGTLENRLASGFAKIALATRQELFRLAASHKLSAIQAQLLGILAQNDAVEVGKLASRLGLTAATVSDSITSLERRKLLKRQRDDADKRRVLVRATVKGKSLGEELLRWPDFLVASVQNLPAANKAILWNAILHVVLDLIEKNVVQEARICISCRHFRPRVHVATERPHHCMLVDQPLSDTTLRFDCPEHKAVSVSEVKQRLRILAAP